jgi:hypothetical protein
MRLGATLMSGPSMRRLSTALCAATLLAALPSVSSALSRVSHAATLMSNGDLLITGGVDQTGVTLKSVDLIATARGPAAVTLGAASNMNVFRASHTATLLTNGCALIFGGNRALSDAAAPIPADTAEIFDPATRTFTVLPAYTAAGAARYNHTATLLNDGRVLICGGQDSTPVALANCIIYTPPVSPAPCTGGTFASGPGATQGLLQARYNHTAILLKDGKVWFAGGANPAIVATGGYLSTTERYFPDPAGTGPGSFQSASPLIEARSQHTATLMGDGKALVVGGFNKRDVLANKGITESAEIFDPISNSVVPAASMSARRHAHSAVLSANGTVDILGGLGNITTSFVDAAALLAQGNSITFAPVIPPTATITAAVMSIPLDFTLSKPVSGIIQDGEMWLSSPTIHADWGTINFVPASQTVPGTGARINLAGVQVGCDPVTGICGNVKVAVPISVLQAQGQAFFYKLKGLAVTTAIVKPMVGNNGTLRFSPDINSGNNSSTLDLAGTTSFKADISLPMSAKLVTYTINSGYCNLSAGTLVQIGSFTVVLSSGGGNIPANVVKVDANGNPYASFPLTFSGVQGRISFNGTPGMNFTDGTTLPDPATGIDVTAGLTITCEYTTNGADLSGEGFRVDVATVVIRKMVFADHETYNPKANAWTILPDGGLTATDQRYGHSATLLPNNDTVIFGGRACAGATCGAQTATLSTGFTLVYSEKNFATAGTALGQRAFHTTTLLPSGKLLIAGGTNGPSVLSSAEILDPVTGILTATARPMRYVRDLHSATLLPNGRVLLAGGFTTNADSTGSTNTSEIFYPDTGQFLETLPMISSRSNHTAIMLPDGRVFVAGGFGPSDVITPTAEIYISTEGRWMSVAPMPGVAGTCERAIHATVQLKDGRIMLIGGINQTGVLDSVAFYTPATNSWVCSGAFPAIDAMPTPLRSHSATLLSDGRVLVAGGNDGLGEANVSYIYDPLARTWTTTGILPLTQPRFNHTSTLLPNGNVLITGGSQRFGNVPTYHESFHVNGSSWVVGLIPTTFANGPRAFHTMTLGLNNKLYAVGGSDGIVGGIGVSLYNAVEAGYFTATPDDFTKNAPPSFRQSTIGSTSATPFLPGGTCPGTNCFTANGNQFRGGTEASGGGAASANSSFSFPHMVLQQVDGSSGGGSQANGGFSVDLTTEIFANANNLTTLNTSLAVKLPATSAGLPYGWYALRTGANDLYSNGTMVQVGPPKPTVAPQNVLGIVRGVSSMTWSWDTASPPSSIDGYNVYNATTGVFISSVAAGGGPRTTFITTGLAPSATDAILVAAYTLTGDGPLTNSPTSYTLSTTPINVTIASVTFSNLLLYWGTNGNGYPSTTYEVTMSTDGFVNDLSTPVPKIFSLVDPFTTISNLAPNTAYSFRVRAYNPVGSVSPYSLIVTTQTRAAVTAPKVTVLGRTTISLNWDWDPPSGVPVLNYNVFNATTGVLLAQPVGPAFPQVGLGTNTVHSIMVTAVTAAGEGPLSPIGTAYTNAATPNSVAVPIVFVTTGSFTLVWGPNGNPLNTRYRVEVTQYAPDGTAAIPTQSTTTGIPFQQGIGSYPPSTKIKYALVAVNGEGFDSDLPGSMNYVTGTTWTYAARPLIIPDPLATTPTSITVGWGANSNSSSATYEVTYSTNMFIPGTIVKAVDFAANFRGTSFTIPGLVTSASYTIRVQASNPFGQLSPFSDPITTATFNGGGAAGSIQGTLSANADSTLFGTLGNLRDVLIRAPAHAFPSDVVIAISSNLPSGAAQCANGTGIGFSITNTPALQPTGSVYLTFGFAPAELGAIPASRALLLRYDPGSGTCVPLETTVNTASGQMTARINHFSLFQVGQVAQATSAESARIFPNPYYAGRDGFLTIADVPPLARVRIFTLRGEQVLDVKANAAGLLTWSGTNGSGRPVASGVYLLMVESGGSKKVLKLAVIR